MVTRMRVSWVLCLVMVHLPMDTGVSGEPGTQRRGEKIYQTRYRLAEPSWPVLFEMDNFVKRYLLLTWNFG